jgi:hypothetical protein
MEESMRLPFPASLLIVTVALPGVVLAQGRPQRPPQPGDKTKGEEEQIRLRDEWFRTSRGLDKVERPDLLRAQAGA